MDDEEQIIIATLIVLFQMIGNLLFFEHEDNEDDNEEDHDMILCSNSRNEVHRINNYIEDVVANYNDTQFQQNFRITREAYEQLLTLIGPALKKQGEVGRNTISIEKQILSVLWLLATPDSYRSVGERFDLAKSSLAGCFTRVVKALVSIAPQVIKWPSGNRLVEVERGFHRMAGISNVIGAVDGTYIVIKAPKEDPVSYITRKCNYAMTLQATCDHTLRYTDVFVGFPGSVSDTRIFKNSDLYRHVLNNPQTFFPGDEFIVGDKAYPTLTWCIPPFVDRGNLTAAQRSFNTKLSQTRQTIERSFALLFGRFRRLKYLDMNRTDFIPSTVLACCVLHNICLDFQDLYINEYIRGGLDNVKHNVEVDAAYQQLQNEGRNKRAEICRTLWENN